MPYSDDGGWWGEEACYETFIEEYPALADNAEFNDRFDDLFADDLNWDEAQDAYDRLVDFLEEYDNIDIDEFFNWQDWRAEHMDS